MIAEIAAVMQEESLLSDELRIMASDVRGLTAKDRESLRKSAAVLEQIFLSYATLHHTLQETGGKLAATEDRLREANAALIKEGVFAPIKGQADTVWHPWGAR